MSEKEKEAKIATPPELLSPLAQGTQNALTTAAIKEVVSSMIRDVVGPLVAELALTPDKIQALKTPFVDPSAAQREQREKSLQRADEAERLAAQDARKKACYHKYPTGQPSISATNNFPDRAPRFVCMICGQIEHPAQWVIDAPTILPSGQVKPGTERGTPRIEPATSRYAEMAAYWATKE